MNYMMRSQLNDVRLDAEVSTKVYPNGVMISLLGSYEYYLEWKQTMGNEYFWELLDDDGKCVDGMFLSLHSVIFEATTDEPLLIILELRIDEPPQ